MMGRQRRDQGRLFYEFRLEDRIPENHLLRRINVFVTVALADLHKELEPHYSDIGRPSVDPELMIRMLIVGYCYGIRSERKLCQEVALHLAYRWFCKLDLDDEVPHHSTLSTNRLGRFHESDLLRHIFERVVWAAMAMGLIKGEGFAVDASVMEANASRYHGKAPEDLAWTDKQRQARAVAEYLAALDEVAEPNPDRKPPKVISPSDPSSAWTAKANKRVQFGYGLNYLIDIENAVIVDVEAPFKAKCCPKEPARKVPRDLHEDARDVARRKMDTKAFLKSRDQRKRVEMRFAHLKTHHGFERMRLRGLSGARDEFHLAAIVQNLKTLALRLIRPPPLQRAYA